MDHKGGGERGGGERGRTRRRTRHLCRYRQLDVKSSQEEDRGKEEKVDKVTILWTKVRKAIRHTEQS